MAKLSKLLTALGAACAISSAQAIEVGGVVWDPNSLLDFTTTDFMIETIAGGVGSSIQGYARITSVNGEAQAVFCPGCELTYTFSGYTVTNVDPVTGALTFSGGIINVWVDASPDFNVNTPATAGDGDLWLQLGGHAHVDAATGLLGTLHSDPTPAAAGVAGDGRGFLDVIGGLAAAFFDTNTFVVNPGLADFQFTSSFQLIPGGPIVADGVSYGLFGSNDLQGNSITVPEPGTLLLAGLGLVGAGLARRQRR